MWVLHNVHMQHNVGCITKIIHGNLNKKTSAKSAMDDNNASINTIVLLQIYLLVQIHKHHLQTHGDMLSNCSQHQRFHA